MLCPRCGRPVNETANFCGGCGLPKAEIERMINEKQAQSPDIPAAKPANTDDLHSTIERLEADLSGVNPVLDYTTDSFEDTNTIKSQSDFVQQEMNEERKSKLKEDGESCYGQSRYSANAPRDPFYSSQSSVHYEEAVKNHDLSTVDYIWMMLISGLPFAGLVYLIWLAFFQKENPNKTSYARATLIISLFATLLAVVFAVGIVLSQISMFH